MASREAVTACLKLLQLKWPDIARVEGAIEFWEIGLRPYTDEQVALGTELVIRYHNFGPPAPGHFAEQIVGKTEKELTDSCYAVAYRDVTRFSWEENGHPPPGGLTGWEARRILEACPEAPALDLTDGATIREGSPQRLSRLLEGRQ